MIYLDYNATAPLLPAARAAMLPWLGDEFGNASSAHRMGARARKAVESARDAVAAAVGAQPSEIVFTSGGTESNNLAVSGMLEAREHPHVVASPIEHSSVMAPLQALARRGVEISWLPVDAAGRIDPDAVEAALRPNTVLMTVGWANNEIGTVQNIPAIAKLCRARGIRVHVDAVQAFGKIDVDVADIDLCSLSAHKIGGPQGAGALFVRRGTALRPLAHGGSQERGVRPGTENVAAIVGFAAAVGASGRQDRELIALRERLWDGLSHHAGLRRNSPVDGCLPNTLHVSVPGINAEAVVAALDLEGMAVSAGAACSAGAAEPSHVLRALGRSQEEAREGVRFSLGWQTTADEIGAAAAAVGRVLQRLEPIRSRGLG
jgi:cysteine desulfurase